MKSIRIRTNKRVEIIDITSKVEDILKDTNIDDGIAVIFTKHTTTALAINEYEPGLIQDLENMLEKLVPENAGYLHDRIDNNADSHLRAMLLNSFLVIPIMSKKLGLGTWQRILFLELDGPREREITISVISQNE